MLYSEAGKRYILGQAKLLSLNNMSSLPPHLGVLSACTEKLYKNLANNQAIIPSENWKKYIANPFFATDILTKHLHFQYF